MAEQNRPRGPTPIGRGSGPASRRRWASLRARAALLAAALLPHGSIAGALQPDPAPPPNIDEQSPGDAPGIPPPVQQGPVAAEQAAAAAPPPALPPLAAGDTLAPASAPPREAPPAPPPPIPSSPATSTGPQASDGTVSVLAPSPPPPPLSVAPPAVSAPNASAPPALSPPNAAAVLVARGLAPPYAPIPGEEALAPRPVPLLEALERSGDRSRRLWITQAYWKLAAASLRHRFAVEAEERLSLVAPGGSAEDLVHLELSLETARGRSAGAGAELVAAQQELADLVRLPVTDAPAMAADHPLSLAYQTHFETIFASRPATGRVRAIHRQLPLQHRAVVARAQATYAAVERFNSMETLNAQGKKPLGAVITANEGIVTQQEAFVDAVLDYNLAIAEYVMAVADLSVPDERFAAMLIGQPLPWRPSSPQGDRVIPVSGQLPRGIVPAEPAGTQPPVLFQSPGGFAPAQASPPPGSFAPGG